MSKTKVAITLDETILQKVDNLVTLHIFPNRSRAIEDAVQDKLKRLEHGRLARECAKLDRCTEKAFAEEGMAAELAEWPEY
jgi:metal-responsive CopG/Arc/MetJ family transcriptional regulator